MLVLKPNEWTPHDRRPAALLWPGGGWTVSHEGNMRRMADVFVRMGMVAFADSYPLDPSASFEYAVATYKKLYDHSKRYGVHPDRFVLVGASAGAALANWTAKVCDEVAGLILLNPVLEPDCLGDKRNEQLKDYLPVVHEMPPPTLMLHGRADAIIPLSHCAKWRCATGGELEVFESGHGFFNTDQLQARVQHRIADWLRRWGFVSLPGTHRDRMGGNYESWGGAVFDLMIDNGLQRTDRVLDIGCGALRVGRHLIPHLKCNRYFGWEKNRWLVKRAMPSEVGPDDKGARFFYNAGEIRGGFEFVLCYCVMGGAPLEEGPPWHLLKTAAEFAHKDTILLLGFLHDEENRIVKHGGWGQFYYTHDKVRELAPDWELEPIGEVPPQTQSFMRGRLKC